MKPSSSLLQFALASACILFYSCQKEIDWGLGGSNSNQRLVKVLSKTGSDSTEVTYSYDASRRLIREKTTGVSAGTVLDNELKINRNANGIIVTTVQKAAELVPIGIDSIITRYNYNSTTAKYTSSIFVVSIGGFNITDSAVYTYDAGGRIISDLHFLKTGFLPPIQSLSNQYAYSVDGKNLSGVQILAATTPGGPLTPAGGQVYTFDNKVSPLVLQNEAILLSRANLYSIHNSTRLVVTNTASPSSDFTLDITYRYNAANKPDSSFSTRTPGGAVTRSKYFYQ